jgi:hypothetical protein
MTGEEVIVEGYGPGDPPGEWHLQNSPGGS